MDKLKLKAAKMTAIEVATVAGLFISGISLVLLTLWFLTWVLGPIGILFILPIIGLCGITVNTYNRNLIILKRSEKDNE